MALQKFLLCSHPAALNLLIILEPEAIEQLKTYWKAIVTKKKLNAFSLLTAENGFATSLNFEDIIYDFASSKVGRTYL